MLFSAVIFPSCRENMLFYVTLQLIARGSTCCRTSTGVFLNRLIGNYDLY